MPFLPWPRSRVSVTGQKTVAASATGNSSSFFTRLPPEVRRQILVAAFGGRTLHMDLRLGPALLPPSERPPVPTTFQRMPHGGITADLYHYGQWPREVLDAARGVRQSAPGTKPVWEWWSCECHGSLPSSDNRDRAYIALWQDRCVHGEARWCDMYPGEAPGKCLIGCMGWLTACRQA